jgi:hypothetical protein
VSEKPVCWGLWDATNKKLEHKIYQRQETAERGALERSNRWKTLVAVPLFMKPAEHAS